MIAARTKLSQRLCALEDRVSGTIGEATDAVRDTAVSVRETAQELTGNVKSLVGNATDKIEDILDLRKHVRNHPVESTLAVLAAGVIAGLVSRKAGAAITQPAGHLFEMIRREALSLGETAIAATSKTLKDNLEAAVRQTGERLKLAHSSSSA